MTMALMKDSSLVKGGNRVTPAGTKVKVVENDVSSEVLYTIDSDTVLLDGEQEILSINITADVAGTASNVPQGLIQEFVSLPFSTATVTNPERIVNGKDRETDSELRDRVKLHVQGLSKGVAAAIYSAVTGLEDPDSNTRVVSAKVVETNELTEPSICYIDDGTGFEPTYSGKGQEAVVSQATGGENILQLDAFPIVKAFSVSGSLEPFDMTGSLTLEYTVNRVPETLTFGSSDFENSSQATAEEVAKAVNLRSSLLEARTTNGGQQTLLQAKVLTNESIEIRGGTANTVLNFPVREEVTLYLYKNYSELLSKDGSTASIESGNSEAYAFAAGESFIIKVDDKLYYQEVRMSDTDTTAEHVRDRILTQLQGATSTTTSNDTKVSIGSKTEDSSLSKLRVGHTGALTSVTSSTTFSDTGLSLEFLWINQISGLRLLMTSGTYSGNAQEISSYDPVTGQVILLASIGGVPTPGDTYIVDGMANGNTGNPASTTSKLGFSSLEKVGEDKDYTLNRTQGQVELEFLLEAEDVIMAGSDYTRGMVTTTVAGSWALGVTTLEVSVDGGASQVFNFTAGTWTVLEVVTLVNATIKGGYGLDSVPFFKLDYIDFTVPT